MNADPMRSFLVLVPMILLAVACGSGASDVPCAPQPWTDVPAAASAAIRAVAADARGPLFVMPKTDWVGFADGESEEIASRIGAVGASSRPRASSATRRSRRRARSGRTGRNEKTNVCFCARDHE
jgi:hypothetical protein